MAENSKRYYWLKLPDDFFNSKRIKKLRRLAGGDTFTIIYLKMQLKALKTDGVLEYTGIEDNFANELALDIDEDADNVALTVSYLLSVGLLETSDNVEYVLPYAMSGSETAVAKRVRDYREKQKVLHCNTDVTPVKQIGNGEIEIEIEKEIKKNNSRFTAPTLAEVSAYCNERKNTIDAQYFIDYYTARNWELSKGRKVKDWKACVRTWERNNISKKAGKPDFNAEDELKTEDADIESLRKALFEEVKE